MTLAPPSALLRIAAAVALFTTLGGCVERTVTITSEPDGALVWLNDREVGRTPVTVSFVHDGTYDVRLVRDGYEPLLTEGEAKPPWWDFVPLDFFAEILPANLESRIDWHYDMEPFDDDRDALIERARAIRADSITDETESPSEGTTPDSGPE